MTATAPDTRNGNPGAIALKTDPRQIGFRHLLESQSVQNALAAAAPKHLSVPKLLRVALGAMQKNPKLLECTPESVLLSLLQSAAYGLEPDGGPLGQGYLVPFWNGKAKRLECQFIPGYRGLVKLARNSGEVADVWAEVVFECDMKAPGHFSYELGLNQDLKHRRNDEATETGALRYVYAVARFRDGEKKFVVMNARDVEKIKAKSQSKDRDGKLFGPWLDHEPEMWKKTAVRRLCKMLPLSVEVQTKIMADESADETGVGLRLPELPALPAVEAIEGQASEPLGTTSYVGDESDRPATTPEPDPEFLREIADAAKTLDSEQSVQAFEKEYLGRAQLDAERTVIEGHAAEARKKLAGKSRQKELVK